MTEVRSPPEQKASFQWGGGTEALASGGGGRPPQKTPELRVTLGGAKVVLKQKQTLFLASDSRREEPVSRNPYTPILLMATGHSEGIEMPLVDTGWT